MTEATIVVFPIMALIFWGMAVNYRGIDIGCRNHTGYVAIIIIIVLMRAMIIRS